MKTRIPYLLATSLVLLTFAGCTIPEYDDEDEDREMRSTRVLMIGNSYSVSVMRHAPAVADSLAVDLDITSLYIGGCSFRKHMDNVKREWNEEHKPYTLTRNVRGEEKPGKKVNLPEVLDGPVSYDIITIQQASHESWDLKTYAPYGDDLVKLIRKYQPKAKIYVQETWSYTPFDPRLKEWGFDQNEMSDRLHAAYAEFAKRNGLEIIPMGAAVQRWRERLPVKYTDHSFGGDVVGGRYQKPEDRFKRLFDNSWALNSDPFHLNEEGEYLQALVWITWLFKEDAMSCEYVPEKLGDREALLMKEIANELK